MEMLEEGQNQPKNAQKRIKVEEIAEEKGDDRLSALEDCLILEILSRLPSTKEAIRTGTLSKRWTHLWTSVPTLIFTRFNLKYPNSVFDFVLSVDKTLNQCHPLKKLKKFKMDAIYYIRFESLFNNWIYKARNCNVEELDLNFVKYTGKEAEFQLDQSIFFINSCFTNLRFRGCTLNPSGAISWKNLTSLWISYLKLDEDLIVNILSGSPLLETLVLEHYYDSKVDTDLEPNGESDDESKAPNILSLQTQWPQLKKLKKFKLKSTFDTEFVSQYNSQINSWIRYAIRCNVKEITICLFTPERYRAEFKLDQILFTSSCFTELSSDGCRVNPFGAISWKNLRSLCIRNGLLDEVLVENILSGSPVLKTLELDGCYGYSRLDITSKSVKNLVLSGYRGSLRVFFHGSTEDIIEINAPNIVSLTIQNEILLEKLLLINVSCLVKAKLNYTCTSYYLRCRQITPTEAEQEMLKEHIMNLVHVKELELGVICYEALSCLRAKGFIFPSNVKFSAELNRLMML